MLSRWLVDIGGISRATYVAGLILAHFAALQLYKAALISELFMIQGASKPAHPSYIGSVAEILNSPQQENEGGENEDETAKIEEPSRDDSDPFDIPLEKNNRMGNAFRQMLVKRM